MRNPVWNCYTKKTKYGSMKLLVNDEEFFLSVEKSKTIDPFQEVSYSCIYIMKS